MSDNASSLIDADGQVERGDVVDVFEPASIDSWRENMLERVVGETAESYVKAIEQEFTSVIEVVVGLNEWQENEFVPPEVVGVVLDEYDVARSDIDTYSQHVTVAIALSIPSDLDGLDEESEFLTEKYGMDRKTLRGLRGTAVNTGYDSIRDSIIDEIDVEFLLPRDEFRDE